MSWPIKTDLDVRVVKPGDKLERTCQIMEYDVFIESGDSGYVEENNEKIVKDYEGYPHYEFLAAVLKDRHLPTKKKLQGVMRLIYAPFDKKWGRKKIFPVIDAKDKLNLFPSALDMIYDKPPCQFLEIASMSIPKKNRNAYISKALITKVLLRGLESPPIRYALAGIDTVFYQKLKNRNLPWVDLGPPSMYMGSESIATMIDAYQIPIGIKKIVIPVFRTKGLIFKSLNL